MQVFCTTNSQVDTVEMPQLSGESRTRRGEERCLGASGSREQQTSPDWSEEDDLYEIPVTNGNKRP